MIYIYIQRKWEHCILQDLNMFVCEHSAAYAISYLHSFKNIKETQVVIFLYLC